jgi:hypothetical protein
MEGILESLGETQRNQKDDFLLPDGDKKGF